ncbi:MAG: succinate dehydrogenase assembly factor 2 [Pseudomonadota bacterium]
MSTDPIRLKRLKIRSWRRGTREMDLLLGAFFDAKGSELGAEELDLYEEMLAENDHDLYAWVAEKTPVPERFAALIARVRESRDRV